MNQEQANTQQAPDQGPRMRLLEDAQPGDFFLSGVRILAVHGDNKFTVRQGRWVSDLDFNSEEFKSGRLTVPTDVVIGETMSGRIIPGNIYKYDYCRGIEYKGTALLRGVDGYEAWYWTLEGENHFKHKNFVMPVDEKTEIISPEEDLALGNI